MRIYVKFLIDFNFRKLVILLIEITIAIGRKKWTYWKILKVISVFSIKIIINEKIEISGNKKYDLNLKSNKLKRQNIRIIKSKTLSSLNSIKLSVLAYSWTNTSLKTPIWDRKKTKINIKKSIFKFFI